MVILIMRSNTDEHALQCLEGSRCFYPKRLCPIDSISRTVLDFSLGRKKVLISLRSLWFLRFGMSRNRGERSCLCMGQMSIHLLQHAVLGYNLKNGRIISVHFQGKLFNITGIQVCPNHWCLRRWSWFVLWRPNKT